MEGRLVVRERKDVRRDAVGSRDMIYRLGELLADMSLNPQH